MPHTTGSVQAYNTLSEKNRGQYRGACEIGQAHSPPILPVRPAYAYSFGGRGRAGDLTGLAWCGILTLFPRHNK